MPMRGLAVLFVLGALLQQPPDGNPEHRQPPDGWYCSHDAKEAAKRCSCHRVDTSPHCEGLPTEQPACRSWCYREHCLCPIRCLPGE